MKPRSPLSASSVLARVARWQNLIPSFPWIAPGWRAWGRNPRKGRKGSNFAAQCSGAIVQKPEGPNTYGSKNPAIAIWQPWRWWRGRASWPTAGPPARAPRTDCMTSSAVGGDQGCQMAKFEPFLSVDCAGVEGVGRAQSKERKGSNFAT